MTSLTFLSPSFISSLSSSTRPDVGAFVLIDAAGSYRKSNTSESSVVKNLPSIQQVISLNAGWYEYTELFEAALVQLNNTNFAL
jgi:hypothetical protein